MELRDLLYFETIARLEHVGEAAAVLHRTQPALTACIRRLEEFAGAALFERQGRGIRLTAAGEVLLRRASQLRLDVEDVRREMKDLGMGVTGNLRLGVVPTVAQFLLPRVLQKIFALTPSVKISTTVGLRDRLADKLRASELDLIIISEHQPDGEFASIPLGADSIVVVAGNQHPIFERDPRTLSLSDLYPYEWILPFQGTPARDWIDQTFIAHGLNGPRVRMESDMLMTLPTLMTDSELLGFMSRLNLSTPRYPAANWLREVPVPGLAMQRHFIGCWRRTGYVPAAARILLQQFQD